MNPLPQKNVYAIPLTPNDEQPIQPVSAFRVGLAGDVHVRSGENGVVFKNVEAGETIYCLVHQVYEDKTTAQAIVGYRS
jgi:hypothetical protein